MPPKKPTGPAKPTASKAPVKSSSSKTTTNVSSRNSKAAAPGISSSASASTKTKTMPNAPAHIADAKRFFNQPKFQDGKKGSTTNTSKTAPSKSEKPKEKQWTPKDDAARKIQTKYRQYHAKKMLEKKKKEKEEYEELMDKLEKEAFIHIVKMQQEESERKQAKENEERKRKQEEIKRRKKMLEAAFDGDIDVMKDIIKEISDLDTKNGIDNDVIGRSLRTRHMMAIVDCEDANGNTALSEAANGGNADAILFLLERGADPDTQGQFKRTPLYRAAFAGHIEATQVLLENGADPNIYAQDGQTPLEIASSEPAKEILRNWDYSKTELLKKKLDAAKDQRAEQDRQRREAELSKLENVVAQAEKEHDTKQKQLNYACCELNKRIEEHDKATSEGFARTDITLQSIHDQELEVESVRLDVAKARDVLAKAKLRLRESMKGDDEGDGDDDTPGLKVNIKELDDVLFRDIGNRIKDSGKWPLLVDTSGQGSTFLRYRDTNFVNALRPADMEKNNVRRALIGAIRYGKPFVLDMMEVDMFLTCVDRFNEIMPGLMDAILDKSILQEEKYMKLVKKEDGPDYDKLKFNELRLNNFKFLVVTKNPYLDETLLDRTYIIKIKINV